LLWLNKERKKERKAKHPYMEFYQCTTNMVIESYSELVVEGGRALYLFHGMDSDTLYMIYHLSFLVFVYFLPLCCLLVSYIFIFLSVFIIKKQSFLDL
jgi:hypothetical protein